MFRVIEAWIRFLGLKSHGLWFSQRVTEYVLSAVLARLLPEQWEGDLEQLFGAGGALFRVGTRQSQEADRFPGAAHAIPAGDRGHI